MEGIEVSSERLCLMIGGSEVKRRNISYMGQVEPSTKASSPVSSRSSVRGLELLVIAACAPLRTPQTGSWALDAERQLGE